MAEANDRSAGNQVVGWFGDVGFDADVTLVAGSGTIPKVDNFGWLGSEVTNGRKRKGESTEENRD
jgi:hypothetical protein